MRIMLLLSVFLALLIGATLIVKDRRAAQAAPAPPQAARCGYTATMQIADGSAFTSTGSPFWAGQYGGMHLGDDFTGNPGDAVFAPWAMTVDDAPYGVTYTGEAGYTGWRIQGHFEDGYLFYAGHLIDVYVQAGQRVPACTQIGTLGATTGPHTHIKMASPDSPIPCEGSPPGGGGCIDPMEYWDTH